MRILHFADVHARDADILEIEKCLGFIVETARKEQPDLIIMAGDTFDSRMVRLDSQAAKLIFEMYSQLADEAPMVVITGTPSHDGLTVQVLSHVIGRFPIHVSDFPEQILLTESGGFTPPNFAEGSTEPQPRAIISCIPTPTKQYWQEYGGKYQSAKETDAEVAQAMSSMLANFGAVASDYDCPHILVGHFSVGGAFISETQQLIGVDIELSRDQIGLANADLVCLGHIHLNQKIGENIFYSGSIYRKDFGELEEKGFYLHDLNQGMKPITRVSRLIEIPTRNLVKLSLDLTNGNSLEEVLWRCSLEDVRGAFVLLELKVWQDEAESLDLQLIEKELEFAEDLKWKIQRVPRETVRSAKLLELARLRDKIREMALLRKEEAPESILAKADMLESMEADEVYKAVGAR